MKPTKRRAITVRLRQYFISGLLVWLPILVTVIVIKFIVNLFDNSLLLLPQHYQPEALFGFYIPGLGVIMTIIVILLTGAFAANFIGRAFVSTWDTFISHIPLVRTIHKSVKNVLQTVMTPGGQSFRKVLLVEFPRKKMWTVAFQTGEGTDEIIKMLEDNNLVSLFIPTTPNVTSGFIMIVPKKDTIELNMTIDEAFKYVISLGVMTPNEADNLMSKSVTSSKKKVTKS